MICESKRVSRHLEIAIRVDYRLNASCCSSSLVGLARVKSLLKGSENQERNWIKFEDHLDRPWMERTIVAAEDRQGPLGQVESPQSQQDLFREYSDEHEGDRSSAMSFIIGEADYINSLMECFNCIFNPKFPTVGELWQVFTDYRQWRRRCEGNYTLSSLAHTQREELSQLKRSIGKR